MFKSLGMWFLSLIMLLVTLAILDASGIFWESKIGIWRENTKRQVFEQSKSYVQGQIQQLQQYHHEWVLADKLGKKSIESVVRHQFADFNAENITDPELRSFLFSVRSN